MRIQIIGGSGTGKSTLAKYIAAQEGIYWIDTDDYLWPDDTYSEKRPEAEREAMLAVDLNEYENYIASGSVYSWSKQGFYNRELLVLLMLDEDLRMKRVRNREVERKSLAHVDDTNEFIQWCETYLVEQEPLIGVYKEHELQMESAKCPVLVLDADYSVEDLYREIKDEYYKTRGET